MLVMNLVRTLQCPHSVSLINTNNYYEDRQTHEWFINISTQDSEIDCYHNKDIVNVDYDDSSNHVSSLHAYSDNKNEMHILKL